MERTLKERLANYAGEGEFPVISDGEIYFFYKIKNESSFLIIMSAPAVKRKLGENTYNSIEQAMYEQSLFVADGSVVLGKYWIIRKPKKSSNIASVGRNWMIIKDTRIESLLTTAINSFEGILSSMGRWSSFMDYLMNLSMVPAKLHTRKLVQLPMNYHWITGPLSKQNLLHQLPTWDDKGLFVLPARHILLIYSNRAMASLAAYEYGAEHKVILKAEEIDCLGCFLNAASNHIPREALQGAILDEQWYINLLTCAEAGCKRHEINPKIRHFQIDDNGTKYELNGCSGEGIDPTWEKI